MRLGRRRLSGDGGLERGEMVDLGCACRRDLTEDDAGSDWFSNRCECLNGDGALGTVLDGDGGRGGESLYGDGARGGGSLKGEGARLLVDTADRGEFKLGEFKLEVGLRVPNAALVFILALGRSNTGSLAGELGLEIDGLSYAFTWFC